VVAALYLLGADQRVFHGKADGENATVRDITFAERAVIAPLIVLIVGLGVFPGPVLDRIQPAVDRTLNQITLANCPAHLVCSGAPIGSPDTGGSAISHGGAK
jgi:NADH:ubiquinone oxidoreductase subunit 4 (subunit M)